MEHLLGWSVADKVSAAMALAWIVSVTLLMLADAGVFGEDMQKAVEALKGKR